MLKDGAPGRIRTCDQEIRRLLLYPLSYGGDGLNSNTRSASAPDDDPATARSLSGIPTAANGMLRA